MTLVTKPRLQRKWLFQAPAHVRYKHFSAPLSPELKKSHKTNAVPVRVGDTVRIMRGERKGIEGKVSSVDRKNYRIFIEGVTREKVDGTAVPVPIHPSKVMLIKLNLDDKWRNEILKRKGAKEKAEEEKPKKKKEKAKRKPKPRKKVAEKTLEEQAKKEKKKTKRKTAKETEAKKEETGVE
ncbi:MAG: 50S ribosomal protein L24 [Candidatus Bathyarchaeia archaeon]|nr:50S ribosomal protein L24 [Candidatus Bathyarchaeota archaeon A05DMB-4]MDH7595615.1 50S ribosomal protein L24 [Candidatus Bathyarchaeota archaeon]